MLQHAMNLGVNIYLCIFLVIVYVLCSDFRVISRANVTKILVYMSPKGAGTRKIRTDSKLKNRKEIIRATPSLCNNMRLISDYLFIFLVIVYVLCSDFRAISRANVTKILVYMSPKWRVP